MNSLVNNLDFKRSLVQHFDPTTDYSEADPATIDGAFEATIYQLLLERQNKFQPSFAQVGDTVIWGDEIGKVKKAYYKPVTVEIKGTKFTRNGSKDNPALIIFSESSGKVIKLASEVAVAEEIDCEEAVAIAYSHDYNGQYDHIDLQPTKGMIESARQAIKRLEDSNVSSRLKPETLKWVRMVASGHPLSIEKCKKGYKFFRNSINPGEIDRLCWFGDDGQRFFNRVWKQVHAANTEADFSGMDNTSVEFGSLIHKVVKWNSLHIGVEYLPGQVRFPGHKHSKKLRSGYGHVRSYRGADGEALDCYLAPEFFNDGDEPSDRLWQVTQLTPEGKFDEHKYMLGYPSEEEAKTAYLKEMPAEFFGGIREQSIGELHQYKKQNFSEKDIDNAIALLEELKYGC